MRAAQAKTLAAQAEYQYADLENWPAIKEQATNPGNYISGKAVNHYELYETDFDYAAKMGMNTFRFSIEWSRVEPEDDVWNAEAIQHYKQYIAALKKRGLEPVVTLFHFTLPVWFAQKGGFEKKANVRYFTRFVERIMHEVGGSIRYVITINEPEVYAFESYYTGNWPPCVQSKKKVWQVLRNLAYAHNQSAKILHSQSRRYKVSVAKHSVFFYAGDDAVLSRKTADIMQHFQDDYFLRKVAKQCDFLGINYYMSHRVYGYRVHNPDNRVSDMGWDLNPAALEQALQRVYSKYHLPILITENGLADGDDEQRKWWLMHTLMAMQRAMESGVELIGYLHWSLVDNFEWDKGFWPQFGLLSVDRDTLKRRPRPSAIWFAGVIKKMRGDGQ